MNGAEKENDCRNGEAMFLSGIPAEMHITTNTQTHNTDFALVNLRTRKSNKAREEKPKLHSNFFALKTDSSRCSG